MALPGHIIEGVRDGDVGSKISRGSGCSCKRVDGTDQVNSEH